MTNKVIKFPERPDQRIGRIVREHNNNVAQYKFKVKRANWFSAGLFTGMWFTLVIGLISYWFWG